MAEIEERAITARIKEARKLAGYTQPQMARELHVESRTYQNYESQTSPRVPWDKINTIARLTGKSSEWITHGSSPDLMGTLNGDVEALARIEAKLDEILAILTGEQEDDEDGLGGVPAELRPTPKPQKPTGPKRARPSNDQARSRKRPSS